MRSPKAFCWFLFFYSSFCFFPLGGKRCWWRSKHLGADGRIPGVQRRGESVGEGMWIIDRSCERQSGRAEERRWGHNVGGGTQKKSRRWRERGRDIKRMSKGQSQIVRTPGRHMGVTERKTESDSFSWRPSTTEGGAVYKGHVPNRPSIHPFIFPSIHPSVRPSLCLSPPRLLRGQELLRKTAVSSFIERGSFHKYVYLVRSEF